MSGRDEAGVARGAGVAVFGGILLGLAITKAFDTFFFHAGGLASFPSLWQYFIASLNVHLIKVAQLFVFLFTAVRFYWGTYRYHEESRGQELHGAHFVLGMFGAILVFSGFYVTAVFITNVSLFYGGFFLFHFFDFLWFICLRIWGGSENQMQVISKAWTMFDVLTLVLLALCIVALTAYPGHLVIQWIMLGLIFAIGLFDLCLLWFFYTNNSVWRTQPFRWEWATRLMAIF